MPASVATPPITTCEKGRSVRTENESVFHNGSGKHEYNCLDHANKAMDINFEVSA